MFTGGLGPRNDLTKETVAACFGDTLTFDETEWEKITAYFARTGRKAAPDNRKQAMCRCMGRRSKTAAVRPPVSWFEQEGRSAVLMPPGSPMRCAVWGGTGAPALLARQNLPSS